MEHPGSSAGSSVLALVPAEDVGVFVSSSATYSLGSDRMVSALMMTALDLALGLPIRDWVSVMGAASGTVVPVRR